LPYIFYYFLDLPPLFCYYETIFVLRFILKIVINSAAFFLIAREFLNIDLAGQWKTLAVSGLILGLINYLIR